MHDSEQQLWVGGPFLAREAGPRRECAVDVLEAFAGKRVVLEDAVGEYVEHLAELHQLGGSPAGAPSVCIVARSPPPPKRGRRDGLHCAAVSVGGCLPSSSRQDDRRGFGQCSVS